jgi:hypothetical protein
MTTQMFFTVVVSVAGLAGIIYGLWVIKQGEMTLRRGTTTETITGRAARRIGVLIVIGAITITVIDLIVVRPMF